MKNRLLCLAFAGLPILINLSCSKEDPSPNPISVEFSKTALEYVQLTEGTRLVYRDSATSIEDTVMVTKSSLKKVLHPEYSYYDTFFGLQTTAPVQNADHFSLILTRMNSGAPQETWFEGEATAYINYLYISIDNWELDLRETYRVESTTDDLVGIAFAYWESYSGDLVAITVEGTTYQNVLVCYDNGYEGDINSPLYRKATYYWAKGVGIIKRTIVTTGGLVKTSTLVSID